ncbi:hypothetical protein BSKO_00784 [Bryopsis sp. KO-2023]|nr:hypothetical protein BSKO_00784 [Bryopsis sp. KO-2023]
MTDACTSERGPFGVPTPPGGKSGRRSLPLNDGKTCSSRSLEPIMSGVPFAAVEEALLGFISESAEDSQVSIGEELVRRDTPPPLDIVPVEKPASGNSPRSEGLPVVEKQ